MNGIAKRLRGMGARSVAVVGALPEGAGDLPDYIASRHASGRAVDLTDIADNAEIVESESTGAPKIELSAADRKEVARLAALPRLDYDREREDAAERMGVRVSTLDAAVQTIRAEAKAGALEFDAIKPWPEKVNGEELLDGLVTSCRKYIILPPHADTALALWVLFTHLIETVSVAPILAVTSPTMRCGKTTSIDWIARLVARPMPASNISAAALFRTIEAWKPTLLVDEADSFLEASDELRGVINSGHTRATAFVIRTTGDNHEPARFSTWGAKLIALIGTLPPTLTDRSISISLRRKLSSERTTKLRDAQGGEFERLARQCARWAADNDLAVQLEHPKLPAELHDRAGDNWEALLSIAAVAGGKWPRLARAAAIALRGTPADPESAGLELLVDMRSLFENEFAGAEWITTEDLIKALAADEEKRWATYNHRAKEPAVTARQVAKLLRPFGVATGTCHVAGKSRRGYRVSGLYDLFARYVPSKTRYRATEDKTNTSDDFPSARERAPHESAQIEKEDKPMNANDSRGSADKKPKNGSEEIEEAF